MTKTLVALLLLSTTAAFADPAPGAKTEIKDSSQMANDDCARARKLNQPCKITFDSERVGGEVIKPGGDGIAILDFGKAGSLIRIRRDFIAEIIKTTEDL